MSQQPQGPRSAERDESLGLARNYAEQQFDTAAERLFRLGVTPVDLRERLRRVHAAMGQKRREDGGA